LPFGAPPESSLFSDGVVGRLRVLYRELEALSNGASEEDSANKVKLRAASLKSISSEIRQLEAEKREADLRDGTMMPTHEASEIVRLISQVFMGAMSRAASDCAEAVVQAAIEFGAEIPDVDAFRRAAIDRSKASVAKIVTDLREEMSSLSIDGGDRDEAEAA